MNKVLPFILALFFFCNASAQIKKKKNTTYNRVNKEGNTFLHKQWWIGIKGGLNLSDPLIEKSYSILTPTNYDLADANKQYEKYHHATAHVALDVTFNFRGFSLSVQPGYQKISFEYANRFQWTDSENAASSVELGFRQEQYMEYLNLPLLLKYEFTFNKISPYIQAGVFTSLLLNANKKVTIEGSDLSAGGPNEFESEPVIVGATDLFAKNHFGIIGGAGVFYTMGNVRLNLDFQFQKRLSLVNSPENRYDNDRLSGIGDAMDDLKLNTICISAGILFPLRFLSSGFKSFDNNL